MHFKLFKFCLATCKVQIICDIDPLKMLYLLLKNTMYAHNALCHLPFLISFVTVLFICFTITISEYMEPYSLAYFKTHPTDVSIKEGEDTSFSCTVSEFNARTDSVTWYVSPNGYYSVISYYHNKQTLDKTSTITVYDVGRNQQRFQCVLRSLYGAVLKERSSKVATMHVEYFPRPDEISCGPNPLNELREESILTIWCKVHRGSPDVELGLLSKEEKSNASLIETRSVTKGDILILNHEVHLRSDIHSNTYECIARSVSPSFLGQEINCSIGPLLVRHKPEVAIHSAELLTQADNIVQGQIALKCVASGYPQIERYAWNCFPADSLLGCDNVTSDTLRIGTKGGITESDEMNIIISCSVTNPQGTTTANLSLPFMSFDNVRKTTSESNFSTREPVTQKHVGGTVCKNVIPHLKLLNKFVNWTMLSFQAQFVCSLQCLRQNGDSGPVITWFVNASQIEYDNYKYQIRHDIVAPISYLMVRNNFRKHDIITTTCNISFDNSTYEKSMNLTFLQTSKDIFQTDDDYSVNCTPKGLSQQSIHPLTNENPEDRNGQNGDEQYFLEQLQTTKSALIVEKIAHGIGHSNIGVKWVVVAAISVFGVLLVTAFLFVICIALMFKYCQRMNHFLTPRCVEHCAPAKCVSCKVSQQRSCLNQSDKSNSNEDTLYEKTVTPPPSPPLLSSNIALNDNLVSKGELSPETSVSYQCSDSITSSICSNTSSDISVPSGYSEWSGQMSFELLEDVDLGNITCTSTEHVYDNAGIIRMHMFPRSASLSRLPRQNVLNETEFPPPALPGSGAKESSRL